MNPPDEPAPVAEMRAEMAAALGLTPEEALNIDPQLVVTWHHDRHPGPDE